jgi:transposase
MNITTIGIDLAKNVFQVHGTDERGKAVLSKVLRRAQMMKFFTQLPPCLIGMEACGSAHFCARQLTALGHTVKLMAPQFVKPYVKSNKNDARDAEAICEAVGAPLCADFSQPPARSARSAVHNRLMLGLSLARSRYAMSDNVMAHRSSSRATSWLPAASATQPGSHAIP